MSNVTFSINLLRLFLTAGAAWAILAPSSPLMAQSITKISGDVTPYDYPESSIERGEEGITYFTLSVAENGRAVECKITGSSGYTALDQKSCDVMMQRAVFDRSNANNTKGILYYSRSIRWEIRETSTRVIDHDIPYTQNKSKVDPYKTRCQFSDGPVIFVRQGVPCARIVVSPNPAPTQKSSTDNASAAPRAQNVSTVPFNGAAGMPQPRLSDDLSRAQAAYQQGNHGEAFRLTLKAARSGLVPAQTLAAWYYREGVGVEVNHEKAVYWLTQAVTKNDPRASYELAIAYMYGNGVPLDFQKSYDYANKSKDLGYVGSQQAFSLLKGLVGESNYSCMEYGFRLSTPDFSQCLIQLNQAKQQALIAQQQADLARRQYELEMRRYEQQLAAYQAQQAASEREESRRQSQYLLRISQGLLSGESFGEASMAAQGTPLMRPTRPQPPQAPNSQNQNPWVCFPTAAALNCRPRP